jgi:hypothetical protein
MWNLFRWTVIWSKEKVMPHRITLTYSVAESVKFSDFLK